MKFGGGTRNLSPCPCKILERKGEQWALGKQLLFDGNFEFYFDLKTLVNDQQALYDQLKEELRNSKGWHSKSLFVRLIEEENDIVEILEYARRKPEVIENYAEMLATNYKSDVIVIYSHFIKSEAGSSSNRKAYQRVCAILNRYKEYAGKQLQQELVTELMTLYKNRPAFLDELSKVK